LLSGTRVAALQALAFHRSRLVRINVSFALSSLVGDDGAAKTLTQLLQNDRSPHVRVAAAVALGRVAQGARNEAAARIAAVLQRAVRDDSDPSVQAAAKAAQGPAAPLIARAHWRTFQVIDRSADDAPVRQEPYFVHGPDGIVWAGYSDARGEINSEHVAPETDREHVRPASREGEY
jgi:HEAT repeat protein